MIMKGATGLKDEIPQLVGQRAGNIYHAHRLCCSESLLLTLNMSFGGELTPETAVRIGSGFCEGLGGAGCLCGSLSSACIVLNLFLGPGQPGGLSRRRMKTITRKMHDRFKERFGSTCCRVLTKKVRHDKKLKRANCRNLTEGGAELAAGILLEIRPDLARLVDMDFLRSQDTALSGVCNRLRSFKTCRK